MLLAASLSLIGCGLGMVHPALGLAGVGLLIWLDLVLWGIVELRGRDE